MRRAALLFNPRAGGRRGGRAFEAVLAQLARGYRLEAMPTRGPEHCRELAGNAARDGLDALFVLGGDGTLRVAAGALAGTPTALGALPGGTTNVVAGALGLPADPVAAARVLAHVGAREMDVGRCGDDVFLMQVSAGLDARVMAEVAPRWKRRVGRLAVAATALGAWARYDFPLFELEVDGAPAAATGFAVTNLAEYGGAFRIVPGARADDRQLELLLYRGRRRRELLGFAFDLARGRHARRADVEIRPVGRVNVLGPAPVQLQADGDAFRVEPPFEIGLSPHRLRVLAPAG